VGKDAAAAPFFGHYGTFPCFMDMMGFSFSILPMMALVLDSRPLRRR